MGFLQVVLLLPAEKASAGLLVTPEFVRDHIGFCEGPMKDMATLVTLGGLRGTIDEYVPRPFSAFVWKPG